MRGGHEDASPSSGTSLEIEYNMYLCLFISVCLCAVVDLPLWTSGGSEDKLWEWVHPLLPYGVQGLNSGRLSASVASMQAHLPTEPSHRPVLRLLLADVNHTQWVSLSYVYTHTHTYAHIYAHIYTCPYNMCWLYSPCLLTHPFPVSHHPPSACVLL